MTDLRDPTQFNEAYRRLSARALAAANQILRDQSAAEDVVQDVFMQLWLKPDSFDPARGSLDSYALMITRSRALDRWRTRSARESAVQRSAEQARAEHVEHESAADPVIRRDSSRRLLGALDGLPGDQRDALLLAYGRGLTAHEIATATGIPLGTAKSRVRLGLRKARENMLAAA